MWSHPCNNTAFSKSPEIFFSIFAIPPLFSEGNTPVQVLSVGWKVLSVERTYSLGEAEFCTTPSFS